MAKVERFAAKTYDMIEIQVYLERPVTYDEAVSQANRIRDMIRVAGEGRTGLDAARWDAQIVDIRGGDDADE